MYPFGVPVPLPHVPFPHGCAQNILLASHLFAVAYFFLTLMEPDPANTWIGEGIGPEWPDQSVFLQYMAALWWSIFVITSIGPAYTSVTSAEQIFSCFYALFGMATHEDMAALKAYVARTNLPAEVERQLKQQLRVQLQMHKSDASSFLSSIPHHLRVTVSRQLYLPIVENLDGFRLCSKAFLKQLVSEVNVEKVMRNDIVTLEGDVSTHLYIVLSGKLVREDGPAAALQSGCSSFLTTESVFGKTAVMCDVPQLFTVRALEHSQLLRLSKAAFTTIATAYPADSALLYSALKQHSQLLRLSKSAFSTIATAYPANSAHLYSALKQVTAQTGNRRDSLGSHRLDVLTCTPSEIAVSQGLSRSPPSWKALGATPKEPAQGKGCCCPGGAGVVSQGLSLSQPSWKALGATPKEAAQGKGAAGPVVLESVAVDSGNAEQLPWKALGTTPKEPAQGKAAAGPVVLESVPVDSGNTEQVESVCAAASAGHVDQLNELLSAAPSLAHCSDYNGRTPLHVAAAHGHVSCINAILQRNGVDVNALDRNGATPVLEAVKNGQSKAAEALQAAGAALLLKDPGATLCRLAASAATEASSSKSGGSNVQYLERLLAAEADVNAQDHAGCTALHVACANSSVAVAKLLMANGANPHLEDMSGNTAYDLDSSAGSPDLLSVLEN
ncbi:unnamed protein product [Closterium sp. NIES-65]|nr:unnamed protein product [Closterium sp. NIES-65]